ncbi:MAG: hypothetical protein HY902_20165 [Deltaproteobacteria bacterium]|nr:hypothetical protein [Deltaproteobacteria bacterium]
MALLRGIETTAIGKTKTLEIEYEKGGYVDKSGRKVAVLDMNCYSCLNAYFVLEDDPIDYCPHCGRREGAPCASYDEALSWARPHEWKYMKKLGLLPYGLRRFDGVWVLGFAKSSKALFDTGKFAEVRCLLPGEG